MRKHWLQTGVGIALVLVSAGCKEPLDAKDAKLARPKALPALADHPDRLETWQRSAELTAQGKKALAAERWTDALQLLAEAVQVAPAYPEARLQLALLYDRAGLGSVALDLLKPCKTAKEPSGSCRYLLQQLAESAEFARLRKTEAGAALLAGRPASPNLAEAADRLATALQKGDPVAATAFSSTGMGFDLIRSCPTCPTEQQQRRDHRPLIGAPMMARLALRFASKDPAARGTPLLVGTPKSCSGLCCQWPLPKAVPDNQAALDHVCVLPDGATEVIATEVEVVYGNVARNNRFSQLPGVPTLPAPATPAAR